MASIMYLNYEVLKSIKINDQMKTDCFLISFIIYIKVSNELIELLFRSWNKNFFLVMWERVPPSLDSLNPMEIALILFSLIFIFIYITEK